MIKNDKNIDIRFVRSLSFLEIGTWLAYSASHKILNFEAFFFVCYMLEHKKMFTFSFELEHIGLLYVKNSKIANPRMSCSIVILSSLT